MKDLKEVLNYELENMQVTENLKIKVLEKCKKSDNNSSRRLYLKAMTVKVASVIFLVISLGYYYNLHNHIPRNYVKVNPVNNNLNKDITIDKDIIKKNGEKIINKEALPKISIINENQISLKSGLSNSKNIVKSSNEEKPTSTIELKKEEAKNNNLPDGNMDNNPVVVASKEDVAVISDCAALKLAEAEKSLNMKITLPSYVPEGYKISSIRETKDKSATIIVNYSSNLSYFYIRESKDHSLDKNNNTNKSITLDNNEIGITWIENQIIYSVGGNLSKDIIESIANSIK